METKCPDKPEGYVARDVNLHEYPVTEGWLRNNVLKDYDPEAPLRILSEGTFSDCRKRNKAGKEYIDMHRSWDFAGVASRRKDKEYTYMDKDGNVQTGHKDHDPIEGQKVYSPVNGVVKYVNMKGMGQVDIQGEDGKYYQFAHMAPAEGETSYKVGNAVKQGAVLGTVSDVNKGYPGMAVHLHVQISNVKGDKHVPYDFLSAKDEGKRAPGPNPGLDEPTKNIDAKITNKAPSSDPNVQDPVVQETEKLLEAAKGDPQAARAALESNRPLSPGQGAVSPDGDQPAEKSTLDKLLEYLSKGPEYMRKLRDRLLGLFSGRQSSDSNSETPSSGLTNAGTTEGSLDTDGALLSGLTNAVVAAGPLDATAAGDTAHPGGLYAASGTEGHPDTANETGQTTPIYNQEPAALTAGDQHDEKEIQMSENSTNGTIKWQDLVAALASSFADELEMRRLDQRSAVVASTGRTDSTDSASGGNSRAGQGNSNDTTQQFLAGIADFNNAVKTFVDHQFQININVSESGTTATGQITRY